MKVKPLHDRLLVTRIEDKVHKKGGIIIPDSAKEKPMEGKVIAVGSGRVVDNGKKVPLEVKVGDRVLFGRYAGTEVKIDDKEHVIVREDEVLGIIQ
jgi:chaperonin GroES